ncbi:MAG: 5-(carboxyamino)imidazole ribonucleotide synthase, partial [Melioribacteraceae bacterium]|nr:5-(carboxyamino)imidazole ribonucleotide synthase [Melioribacteraceae bacterium]
NRFNIGILGGGQLARMSAFPAQRLGFDITILEKIETSPAGQIATNEFVGWIEENEILEDFVKNCDIVTLENEFVDSDRLKLIESFGKKVVPGPETIRLIQDKFVQKTTLELNKIPVPKFVEIHSNSEYNDISKLLGEAFILKSRKMGYDGYGNAFVKNEDDFRTALIQLNERHSQVMAEELISFSKELAIMIVRTEKEIIAYPVVETIQKNHICHTVIAPAQIEDNLARELEAVAINCVKAVNGYGIYGIEFFLDTKGKILVNEMAPRPHNSGHYTIDACLTSQFENHIRAVMNLPLGSPQMVSRYAIMINILGKKNGSGILRNYGPILDYKNLKLHLYGKHDSRIGRKMGHVTILGNNLDDLFKQKSEIEDLILV